MQIQVVRMHYVLGRQILAQTMLTDDRPIRTNILIKVKILQFPLLTFTMNTENLKKGFMHKI